MELFSSYFFLPFLPSAHHSQPSPAKVLTQTSIANYISDRILPVTTENTLPLHVCVAYSTALIACI